jgi:hypothetical protein
MAPILPHTEHKGSGFIRETDGDYWALSSGETVHIHSSPRLKADWHSATCQLELPLPRTARTHVVACDRKCQLYTNKHYLTMGS